MNLPSSSVPGPSNRPSTEPRFRQSLIAAETLHERNWIRWFGAAAAAALLGWMGQYWGLSTEVLFIGKMLALSFVIISAFQAGQWMSARSLRNHYETLNVLTPTVMPRLGSRNRSLPEVRLFSSIDDAAAVGWQFFEVRGNYGDVKIPKYAQLGSAWFEYDGLNSLDDMALSEDQRKFGRFLYLRMTSPPEGMADETSPDGESIDGENETLPAALMGGGPGHSALVPTAS